MRPRTALATTAWLLYAAAACGPPQTTGMTTSSPPSTSTIPGEPPTRPVESPRAVSQPPEWFRDERAVPDELAVLYRERVAEALGVPVDEVEPIGSMSVQWRDSALGCARPGELSLQVITDGYLAYFSVADVLYRVHGATDGRFRICERPEPPEPLPTQ